MVDQGGPAKTAKDGGGFGLSDGWPPDAVLGAINGALGAGICITDRDGLFVSVSDAFCRIYGYARADMIGRHFTMVVPEANRAAAAALHDRFIAGDDELPGEWDVIRADGRPIVIEVGASRFHDGTGAPFKVTTVADVTARRRAEDSLRAASEELVRLNAQKDRLFSIIAHDLRSPLSAVLATTEYLASRADDLAAEQVRLFAANGHTAGRALYALLESLLEWSRLQMRQVRIEPAAVDLSALADEACAMGAGNADAKGVALDCTLAPLTVVADATALTTVIRNLVSNGVKYTPSGGTVSLAAAAVPGGDGGTGAEVEITVRDTGVGMEKERLDTLFRMDAAHSTAGTAGEKGSGLGLLICKELVDRLGGRIEADSAPGRGTVMRVRLPAAGMDLDRPEAI